MFGIGSTELLLILLVALIVLGPKSLASFSSKLGKLIGEFRRASTDFQRTLNLEAAQEEAKEAEKKRAQAAKDKTSEQVAQEDKDVSKTASPTDEELRLHGIPDDSPLAQALKRARNEAANGGKVSEKEQENGKDLMESAESKVALQQDNHDKSA